MVQSAPATPRGGYSSRRTLSIVKVVAQNQVFGFHMNQNGSTDTIGDTGFAANSAGLTILPSKEILFTKDDEKWPFLLRFPISSFSICLGMSSQAIMWKALSTLPSSTKFHQVITLNLNLVIWSLSLALIAIASSLYILKMIFYFDAVRKEYFHPVRINFFFAPWITLLFLVLGAPTRFSENLHHVVIWYVLMTPILCLEVKIYGQWMSGGQRRRLSMVANPSNHLSVLGNFGGAMLGASMGLKEGPLFFFAVGLAHYMVLFVTLYQRLPTNKALPKELHPVFFLFVAAPSVASIAWSKIEGSFDNYGSRIAYFISMFLYFSLAVRINLFRGFRFSLSWWAYTFPMTVAAIATIKYSAVVTNPATKCLTVVLCSISFFTVVTLFVRTLIHAFVLRDLFPNDVAVVNGGEIKPKSTGKWKIKGRANGSENKAMECFENPDLEKDLEAQSTKSSDSNGTLTSPGATPTAAPAVSRLNERT